MLETNFHTQSIAHCRINLQFVVIAEPVELRSPGNGTDWNILSGDGLRVHYLESPWALLEDRLQLRILFYKADQLIHKAKGQAGSSIGTPIVYCNSPGLSVMQRRTWENNVRHITDALVRPLRRQ